MKFTYKKLTQFFSYKILLTVIIIVFTVVPSIVMLTMAKSHISSTITNEYINDYINAIDKKTSENISSLVYHINSLSYYFLTNQSVYDTLINGSSDYENSYVLLKNTFDDFLKDNSVIESVCLISPDKTVYNFSGFKTDNTFLDKDTLNAIQNSELYLFDTVIENDGEYYIPAAKKMYNYFTGSQGGYIILYLNEDIFSKMYKDFQFKDSEFFILLNNTIISHPEKELINSKYHLGSSFLDDTSESIKINDTHLICKKVIDTKGLVSNLEIVCTSSFKSFNALADDLNTKIIFLIVASIFISVLFSLTISSRLLSELEILRKNMSEFGKHPNTYKKTFKLNEIKALENDFKNMTKRINMLIKNISDEKEKQRIAELSALQAQINPHFIYNTLDSVAWLALLEKNKKIYNLISALANFFRISLNRGKNEITISEEIEHVKNYLTIESIRFPEKFTCEYHIDEEIKDLSIIKIIIQPLVENSIKHGFDGMDTGGLLKIKVEKINSNYIEISVADNGCGMDFNPFSAPKKTTHGSGYGIENVNARLKLAYGDKCALTFESKEGKGTTARIKIPINKLKGDKNE